jgi:hypothetical protein
MTEDDEDEDEIEIEVPVNYKFAVNVRVEGQDRTEMQLVILDKHRGSCKDYRDTQVLKQKREIDDGK